MANMSWLSKLAFWRDSEPEITHVEGYEVDGCFVPNDAAPDTEVLSDGTCELPET